MRLLRLRQFAEAAGNYRVTIELDGAGARRSAESRFAFKLTAQDRHYSEAIRLREAQGDLYDAAQIRYNVAIALTKGGRFPDARQYANTALRDFQTYGAGAAAMVEKTLDLISQIDKAAKAAKSLSPLPERAFPKPDTPTIPQPPS